MKTAQLVRGFRHADRTVVSTFPFTLNSYTTLGVDELSSWDRLHDQYWNRVLAGNPPALEVPLNYEFMCSWHGLARCLLSDAMMTPIDVTRSMFKPVL